MCKYVIYIIFQNVDNNYCLGHQNSLHDLCRLHLMFDPIAFILDQINKLNTWLKSLFSHVSFFLSLFNSNEVFEPWAKRADVKIFPLFFSQLTSTHSNRLALFHFQEFSENLNAILRKFIEHKIGIHVRRKLVTGKFNSKNYNRD